MDGYDRSKIDDKHRDISADQWFLIADVVGKLIIVLRGYGSARFNSDTERMLSENFSESARTQIVMVTKKMM